MPSRPLEAFLRGESRGFLASVLRLPLVPPALLFSGVVRLRRRLFECGLRSRERLPLPVISVGNLVVGGTGKTPFVRTLLRALIARGERPLLATRGHGAKVSAEGLDEEARSLVRDLPGLPVAVGRDRALAVRTRLRRLAEQGLATTEAFPQAERDATARPSDAPPHPGATSIGGAAAGQAPEPRPKDPTVVVLDDGAQTLRVHRDLEILLVDAHRPFGSGFTLPAGTLREPPATLRVADLVVVTRSDEIPDEGRQGLRARLARRCPATPIVNARHVPDRLLPGASPPSLRGRDVFLVSAIAEPLSFERTVLALGARIRGHRTERDHAPFTAEQWRAAGAEARRAGAELLLATGKDEPKLAPLGDAGLPAAFLEVAVRLDREGEEILDRALDALFAGRTHEPTA